MALPLGFWRIFTGPAREKPLALEARVEALEQAHAERPGMRYEGVHKPGRPYFPGDCVTRGGSMWVAKTYTVATPGEPNEAARAWVLAVKAGRNGKDGRDAR